MFSLLFDDPIGFVIVFGGVLLSLAFHEFMHAYVADKLGDPTPRLQGRVTLDPRAHLDPIGTLAILLAGFGWGKPVIVDPYNLKKPVQDMAIIAIAGPLSNIAIAAILGAAFQLGLLGAGMITIYILAVAASNIGLAVFNMIPIYPLDGSKVLLALLPDHIAQEYDRTMEQFGIFILFALIIPWNGGASPLTNLIDQPIDFLYKLLILWAV